MGRPTELGRAFEKALFSGDKPGMEAVLHPGLVYETSGTPPIGGRFEGRDRVINAFETRETGLGAGFEYEEISREWFEDAAHGKVFVEIHEKSWLPVAPDDVMVVRTCSVLTIKDDKIVSIIDYTDSQIYSEFKARHEDQIPKFAK